MFSIDVCQTHGLPKNTAKVVAEEWARVLADDLVRSPRPSTPLDVRWDGDRMTFGSAPTLAPRISGTLDVTNEEVRLHVALPLFLRIVRGAVKSRMNQAFMVVLQLVTVSSLAVTPSRSPPSQPQLEARHA